MCISEKAVHEQVQDQYMRIGSHPKGDLHGHDPYASLQRISLIILYVFPISKRKSDTLCGAFSVRFKSVTHKNT